MLERGQSQNATDVSTIEPIETSRPSDSDEKEKKPWIEDLPWIMPGLLAEPDTGATRHYIQNENASL